MIAIHQHELITAWRATLAAGGVAGVLVMCGALVMYLRAARLKAFDGAARISPTAASIGIVGAILTLSYTTTFRFLDLLDDRDFNLGDVLGVLPVAFFGTAAVVLLRDANKVISAQALRRALDKDKPPEGGT